MAIAMVNCPACGHSISSAAASCPNCGHVMKGAAVPGTTTRPVAPRKRVGPGRWLAGLLALILLILVALWYFDIVNFT